MAEAPELPFLSTIQLAPSQYRFCQKCKHKKRGGHIRRVLCCTYCKRMVCRDCHLQNSRRRKALEKEREDRLARQVEKMAKREAEGNTLEPLLWEELSGWADDSDWEEEQLRGASGGESKKEEKKKMRKEKGCPVSCYGECCLTGGWIWLQSKYSEDNARPELYEGYRPWLKGGSDAHLGHT
ncbi:hypothetical protein EJ02DRAFT_155196 [Clathrospora elynae]|uniref:Uncharacterized protein n=1 Tax=Clathrospora elynae TaxID=706981 RepID=A0A6A5SQQ9_9PLEO|nr:hypothetical protein EJ02DRAFT_155196 [Clathrospora elynae]